MYDFTIFTKKIAIYQFIGREFNQQEAGYPRCAYNGRSLPKASASEASASKVFHKIDVMGDG